MVLIYVNRYTCTQENIFRLFRLDSLTFNCGSSSFLCFHNMSVVSYKSIYEYHVWWDLFHLSFLFWLAGWILKSDIGIENTSHAVIVWLLHLCSYLHEFAKKIPIFGCLDLLATDIIGKSLVIFSLDLER